MKNVLVTGGAGFIGSHTVVELVKAGLRPIIVDNFSNSDKRTLENISKITGQLVACYEHSYQDKKSIAMILVKENIEGVIHFAAYKSVDESVKNPLKYYANNVAGLISLLEIIQEHGISYFVFSSSCVVYGEPDRLPVTEDLPIKPAPSPYGTTKQIGEIIVKDITKANHQLRSLSLRYFNPIGAHSSALIGETPKGVPANLVPFVTQTAAGIRSQLKVYGNDYPTPDGTCIRDYIHVVDLAKAHVKALQHLMSQEPAYYDVFNIGTGKGTSVLEVIKRFEKVTGQKVPYQVVGRRDGDIIINYANAKKAEDILGWRAEKSLEEALLDAWRWQQGYHERH